MKVLYLNSYFYPEDVASSYLGQNVREAIIDAGMDIVLYTPVPTRGIDKATRKEYSTIKKNEQWYDGRLVIHRISLFKEGRNPLIRALRYFLQEVKLFNRAVFAKDARNCDIIKVSSTPPIHGLMAAFVKKVRHIPIVYDVQDIFPDSLVGTGLAKKGGLLWKIGRVIENFTYRHADKIIVISDDFRKNLIAKGVPEEKIVVVYNWVDQNAVVDVPREQNKLIGKYNLDPNKFYVTYCGNIGLTQNMEMLLSVAEEFQSSRFQEFQGDKIDCDDIHFVLVGEGAFKKEVERIIEEENIRNITLLPFQPYEDISHVFSLGDVGIIISKPGVGANSVPSKTWSIMSASRPVLANFDENELKSILEGRANLNHNPNLNLDLNLDRREAKPCGIFTKAGDKEAFKQSILALYNDREMAVEMGRNGRQFVMDNLTREVGTQKYVDVIKSVVGKG